MRGDRVIHRSASPEARFYSEDRSATCEPAAQIDCRQMSWLLFAFCTATEPVPTGSVAVLRAGEAQLLIAIFFAAIGFSGVKVIDRMPLSSLASTFVASSSC